MTTRTLVQLMKRNGLTQQAAADLMGVAQPTLHDIIHGHHNLTQKNEETFTRGLARMKAMEGSVDGERVICATTPTRVLTKRKFIEHIPSCSGCLSRAFEGVRHIGLPLDF